MANYNKPVLLSKVALSADVAPVGSFAVSLRFEDSSPIELRGKAFSMRSALTASVMLNSHSGFGNGRPSESFCQTQHNMSQNYLYICHLINNCNYIR